MNWKNNFSMNLWKNSMNFLHRSVHYFPIISSKAMEENIVLEMIKPLRIDWINNMNLDQHWVLIIWYCLLIHVWHIYHWNHWKYSNMCKLEAFLEIFRFNQFTIVSMRISGLMKLLHLLMVRLSDHIGIILFFISDGKGKKGAAKEVKNSSCSFIRNSNISSGYWTSEWTASRWPSEYLLPSGTCITKIIPR